MSTGPANSTEAANAVAAANAAAAASAATAAAASAAAASTVAPATSAVVASTFSGGPFGGPTLPFMFGANQTTLGGDSSVQGTVGQTSFGSTFGSTSSGSMGSMFGQNGWGLRDQRGEPWQHGGIGANAAPEGKCDSRKAT
ncbi:uncharacterized protein LOC131025737 [Salvia miltiorrhiza]|uniref:uncharacterized protein LOC131025737 n=1 Tax=Salvia miltiorrhiza TaxID=226208 RepID=UPI0025AD6EAF|nr:uncharacterized protein LOC131025737 [Salvia miltiorrhiza]